MTKRDLCVSIGLLFIHLDMRETDLRIATAEAMGAEL